MATPSRSSSRSDLGSTCDHSRAREYQSECRRAPWSRSTVEHLGLTTVEHTEIRNLSDSAAR